MDEAYIDFCPEASTVGAQQYAILQFCVLCRKLLPLRFALWITLANEELINVLLKVITPCSPSSVAGIATQALKQA